MPEKKQGNKVSAGAKKFWKTISTGWVIEYPGSSRDGPRDFFDRRDRVPQGVRENQVGSELERCSYNGEEAADRVFMWKEQMRAAGR